MVRTLVTIKQLAVKTDRRGSGVEGRVAKPKVVIKKGFLLFEDNRIGERKKHPVCFYFKD